MAIILPGAPGTDAGRARSESPSPRANRAARRPGPSPGPGASAPRAAARLLPQRLRRRIGGRSIAVLAAAGVVLAATAVIALGRSSRGGADASGESMIQAVPVRAEAARRGPAG